MAVQTLTGAGSQTQLRQNAVSFETEVNAIRVFVPSRQGAGLIGWGGAAATRVESPDGVAGASATGNAPISESWLRRTTPSSFVWGFSEHGKRCDA